MSNEEAIEVIENIMECHTRKNCNMECDSCHCNYSDDELQEALDIGARALKRELKGDEEY